MWPFTSKTEVRQSDYTDAVVRAILNGADGTGTNADYRDTAAAQVGALMIARALAAARIEGAEETRTGLNGATLHDIGWCLTLDGEAVYVIEVSGAAVVSLVPVASHDIEGGPDPATWRYHCVIAGPTRTLEASYPAEAIFHPRINQRPSEPHKGRSPIALAMDTARLAGGLERQLANESNVPSGHVLPAPLDSIGDEALADIRADLKKLKGRTALVPSMAGGWGEGRSNAPSDWNPKRLGFNPPEALATIRGSVFQHVLSLAGVPPALFGDGRAEGKREALRQFLHVTLEPLARVIEREARDKLATSLTFDFTALAATDVQGRARAFKSLVDAGMTVEQATEATGMA